MSKNLIQIIGGIVIYIWNHISCSCENGKYLASIMDDSAIMSDEIIESYDEEIKAVPTNFNEKNITCRTQNFYILLAFLFIKNNE